MKELAKAMLAFQTEPPAISLDATNPHFGSKFASLGGVVAAVRPALTKHGLVVTQLPTVTGDGSSALETRLIHAESGEQLTSTMSLMLTKPDPQSQGSALTYARRYALLAILGLVGDADDDATAAQPARAGAAKDPDPHGLHASSAAAVEPGQVLVPFGKHKGSKVSDVPASYWEWWLAQDGNKNPEVLAAVELHLGLTGVAASAPSDTDDIPF